MAEKPDKDDIRWIVAANVKKYRQQLDLKQEKLSKLCGLHISYVGRLERTPGNPELSTLALLADQLGVTVVDLVSPPKRRSR
jgi:transcriptional regulator with XRE-family HTH domain